MKKAQIAGLLFIVVAIGIIISTVYNIDPYSGFDEARKNPGKEVQIIGELVNDQPITETVEEQTLMLTFFMTDGRGGQSKVTYFGPKPQDFEKSDQVVLIGRYHQGNFIASSLLLKCPSKYIPGSFEQTTFTSDGGVYSPVN
ncbi:MAG TPA: cytochrome c maturation protein CcmE [Bacteroidales bacterium]|nr:cytochrome c maturation protein CcmE [Bacteroidales bacterium]